MHLHGLNTHISKLYWFRQMSSLPAFYIYVFFKCVKKLAEKIFYEAGKRVFYFLSNTHRTSWYGDLD